MVAPAGRAWDRRDDESAARYARFVAYRQTPRSERGKYLAAHSRDREFARAHEWFARVAAFDDQTDRDYEQRQHEAAREVRAFHARAGRALLAFAVTRINQVEVWRPTDLIKLADLARKMEMVAVLGSEQDIPGASRAAVAAAGADVDEWDRLAADLAGTIPTR